MSKTYDFYSGVGGWALGFRLAGISVEESFEWWPAALDTYNQNFDRDTTPQDIRQLDITSLPKRADFVIGSPPCTQFSFSNRGGSGDIQDGLVDLRRFLEIVERLKPRCWAMENVPRVAHILEEELKPGRALSRYAKLFSTVTIVKMEEFGLPQRRRRMLAGRFDEALLRSYGNEQPTRTLGQVVKALAGNTVIDPLYGIKRTRSSITGLEHEEALSPEELRMNREAKAYHPVYNVMAFPDPLNRPSRTVTATCTRVSRESIVIADPRNPSSVRRLSVRERASLQGFPITFEFHGQSHSDRLKMIGNAIPPVLTYFLAHAFRGTPARRVEPLNALGERLPRPRRAAAPMAPDRVGSRYPATRRFQAAIPGLRFGSGMRFEFSNAAANDEITWAVRFYFGASKKYRQIILDERVIDEIKRTSSWHSIAPAYADVANEITELTADADDRSLQEAWTRRGDGIGPFEVVDGLGRAAEALLEAATNLKPVWIANLVARLAAGDNKSEALSAVSRKFSQYDARVLVGLLVGAHFNVAWKRAGKGQAETRGEATRSR